METGPFPGCNAMDMIDEEKIREIVKQVLEEMRSSAPSKSDKAGKSSEHNGPNVLIFFHAGVSRLGEAMNQVRLIQESAGKSSVFTDESARGWVCGEDVRKQAGTRCILDTVKPEGLQKVMERADVLVLPTFCLKVGAKVATLICDDHASGIVCSALARGKKVLASRDGFLLTQTLSNIRIRKEVNGILQKLEEYGITFAPTDQLSAMFRKLALQPLESGNHQEEKVQASGDKHSRKIITARDINSAANEKKGTVHVTKGGVVTPLARDLAKEYGIQIVEGE
jgi:glycosyltransferase involved in cell wall biosynthesis